MTNDTLKLVYLRTELTNRINQVLEREDLPPVYFGEWTDWYEPTDEELIITNMIHIKERISDLKQSIPKYELYDCLRMVDEWEKQLFA